MTVTDWALTGFLVVFLFGFTLFRSRTHLLWSDEVLGYRVLAAPTWQATLHGWYDGADGGGLLYYLLGRVWMEVFGFRDVSLRLFSTAGMALTVVFTWCAARRFASTLAIAAAVASLWLLPGEFLWQAADGRFYGLFMAASAAAFLVFLQSSEGPVTWRLLLATTLVHALLVGSHVLGMVYSVALTAALLLLRERPARWMLATAAASSWLLVPISLHAILATTGVATRTFWTERPGSGDLLTAFTSSGSASTGVLALVLVLYALQQSPLARCMPLPAASKLPRGLALLCACAGAAVLTLFLKSQVNVSIFADRYLLPVTVITILLLSFLLTPWIPAPLTRQPILAGLASLTVLLPGAVLALKRDLNEAVYPPRTFLAGAMALPRDRPLLVTQFPAYNVLQHYDSGHQLFYMLDWPYDLAHSGPNADFSAEHLMENAARAGYQRDSILSCHAIFTRERNLLLLTEPRRMPWLQDRLLRNPEYSVQRLPGLGWAGISVWSVQRLQDGPLPC